MYGKSALKKTDGIQKKTSIIQFMEGSVCFASSSLDGNSMTVTSGEGAQAINTSKKEEISSVSES